MAEFKTAPLGMGFTAVSMIGFLVSVLYIWKFSPSWAFAFAVVFVVMFIASIITMLKAEPEAELGYKRIR